MPGLTCTDVSHCGELWSCLGTTRINPCAERQARPFTPHRSEVPCALRTARDLVGPWEPVRGFEMHVFSNPAYRCAASAIRAGAMRTSGRCRAFFRAGPRSEEHTSELQSL